MSEGRSKRVKTIANRAPHQPRRVRNQGDKVSSSGTRQNPTFGLDPFYAPALQAERLAKFFNHKPTYVRYADIAWMVEQRFNFPHELETLKMIDWIKSRLCEP
ncbi:hypothetical protein Lal_00030194 [Lupinus albus]|nr:hypothetical protein Lal_00030194 [Lupinus albus]